jgi:NADPH2:quinone reductase
VRFGDYTANRKELEAAAQELFDAIVSGALQPTTPRRVPFEQAAEAHRLLEGGETTGPLVLVP